MPVALFFLLAAFWGGSFVAIKFALVSLTVLSAVGLRICIGLLGTLLVAVIKRQSLKIPRAAWLQIFITGALAQAVPFLLLFEAETTISAGVAGILNGTVPLWALALGSVLNFRGEKLNGRQAVGLVLGYLGVACIGAPSVVGGIQTAQLYGLFLLILMAISYAAASILAKKIHQKYQIGVITGSFWYHLSSLIVVFVYGLSHGHMFHDVLSVNLTSLGAVTYMGIFSNTIAFLIFYHLIFLWGPTQATTVTYVVPGFALLFDLWFFGTVPHALQLVGWVVVLCGLWLGRAHPEPAPVKLSASAR